MNADHFTAVLHELIDENPFSARAVLKILKLEFTDRVPTLAVTCEAAPRLLVNLQFITQHCRNDKQLKAVILHEFLHVLLGHTGQAGPLTPARHLAFDAVINAIIHRQYGKEYSAMMAHYYADATDLRALLRPPKDDGSELVYEFGFSRRDTPELVAAWHGLYEGTLVADDIEQLAAQFAAQDVAKVHTIGSLTIDVGNPVDLDDLLGNHEELGRGKSGALDAALDQVLKEMNGSGIWRKPWLRGIGADPQEFLVRLQRDNIRGWREKTLAVLRRHIVPDRQSRAHRMVHTETSLPVLSTGDRRAFLRATWSPFLPAARWAVTDKRPEGTAQVYLDVSGSMDRELPLITNLLSQLSTHIRRPFWAFSDKVSPAIIRDGRLETKSTGGTSMSCVLKHLAETRPEAAVVFTDGYIEALDPGLLKQASATRLHALVTREGNPAALQRAGIPYTQLDRVPS